MPTDHALQSALERNRYFYGLLMDAERFERDQSYFNAKRHLLNRFIEGAGVVCGLALNRDGGSSTLTLSPGLAIDAAGREILVTTPTIIDPSHLTDAKGKAAGPAPNGATVLISLLYSERKTAPVPVLVPDCDHPDGCAPSVFREGFFITVTSITGAASATSGCILGSFPLPPGTALQTAVAGEIAGAFSPVPTSPAVPLGRFSLPAGELDTVSDRPVVYNNNLLFQLISCLAAQVAKIAGVLPVYVSGDNQSAKAGQALTSPLIVAIVDGQGNPLASAKPPVFSVTSGGGSVGPVTPAGTGNFHASWTLGSAGTQTVVATSPQSALSVTFHATVEP